MKIDRHGQAKILTQSEIQLLFSQGLQSDRDRALFGWSKEDMRGKPPL
jgi:integrase/recombinase XerD